MNVILPPTTPQFLTESMFVQHGFFTGTASAFQIQAAFSIAENQIAIDIGTFLTPTTFTGTYPFAGINHYYHSPVSKIISVNSVTLYEKYTNDVERLYSGTSMVTDPDTGLYLIRKSVLDNSSCNGCTGEPLGIYKFEASITAGYATGLATSYPTLKLAMCMAADIVLKQMVDEGIGVTYENMTRTLQVGRVIQTFETRGFFGNTIFGPSARAQYIHQLLSPFRVVGANKLGY